MARIEPFSGTPSDPLFARLLEEGERDGTPDARIIRVYARSEIGAKWIEFCRAAFTEGLLPVRMKELVRIRMSVAEECGYCSSLRSKRAQAEGLTEEIVVQMVDLDAASDLDAREKAALRYADRYRRDEVDSDEVFEELRRHFSDEEIIELGVLCSMLDGGGPFVKSLDVLTWAEACEVRPTLTSLQEQPAGTAAP
jgi:AhpD family alkylhydroperoxidase